MVAVEPDEIIYDCFCGIPMSWSWALWAVHGVVSDVLRWTCGDSHSDLVEDRRPSQKLQLGRPLVGGYVDNCFILPLCFADVKVRYEAELAEFHRLGIMLHELRLPTDDMVFDYLGVDFVEGG